MQSYQTPQRPALISPPSSLPPASSELAKLNAFLPLRIKFFIELLIRLSEGKEKRRKQKE
jgi:hypothetical protein